MGGGELGAYMYFKLGYFGFLVIFELKPFPLDLPFSHLLLDTMYFEQPQTIFQATLYFLIFPESLK